MNSFFMRRDTFYYVGTDGQFAFRNPKGNDTLQAAITGGQLIHNTDILDVLQIADKLYATGGGVVSVFNFQTNNLDTLYTTVGGGVDAKFFMDNQGRITFTQSTPYSKKNNYGLNEEWSTLEVSYDSFKTSTHLVLQSDSIGFRHARFHGNDIFGIGHKGKIWKSSDNGTTWKILATIPEAQINSFVFVNDSMGYCVGGSRSRAYYLVPNSIDTSGFIYQTIDTGRTWVLVKNLPHTLTEIELLNDSLTIAYGTFSQVFITNNELTLGQKHRINKYSEFNFYPNPTKDFLMVKGVGNFQINIYDLTGKPILRKLVNSQIKLDTSSWKAQGYLIVFIADNKIIKTAKVVK